jgi:hypothetical protein
MSTRIPLHPQLLIGRVVLEVRCAGRGAAAPKVDGRRDPGHPGGEYPGGEGRRGPLSRAYATATVEIRPMANRPAKIFSFALRALQQVRSVKRSTSDVAGGE